MTEIGSPTVQIALAVILVIVTAYAAGRVHQWYRHAFERDVAYREGYNQASRTLFPLAVRGMPGKTGPGAAPADLPADTAPIRAVVPFHPLGQHHPVADRH
ncbi:hypothetical protein GCM10020358_81290 [Amorphoplanes nipponensis]|uniref:Uncharacterized protein n=1 Tax=Actinoplanes nipponensis TaxID=135950 RepID=A0A919JD96_9ACTN|nr:hypothetical protein [Actinoplanes nipponensis]GIE47678.1 hypothetical protein Ani05nite_12120 [Actinoplanes nipponensis]